MHRVITRPSIALLCLLLLRASVTNSARTHHTSLLQKDGNEGDSQVQVAEAAHAANALLPRTWSEIAASTGTDKYNVHLYQHVYEEILEPFRHTPLKFLEIGLGCDMHYGPGRSFKLWEEYFTHNRAQINYMEIDGECVAKMNIQPRNGHVYVGSQENVTFLEHAADLIQTRGGLDVLVDDGGHTMHQQLTTLEKMWPHIRPGGLYIVEDVQTSYMPNWGGISEAATRNDHATKPSTFLGRVVELLDELNCDYSEEECDSTLQAVYCFHHACALRKAGRPGEVHAAPIKYPPTNNPYNGSKRGNTPK